MSFSTFIALIAVSLYNYIAFLIFYLLICCIFISYKLATHARHELPFLYIPFTQCKMFYRFNFFYPLFMYNFSPSLIFLTIEIHFNLNSLFLDKCYGDCESHLFLSQLSVLFLLVYTLNSLTTPEYQKYVIILKKDSQNNNT